MTKLVVDLAGFNPAEPRAAGRWVSAGGGSQKDQQSKQARQQALLRKKFALQAEAKHLRALIAALHIGVHRGRAGVHRGQAGVHKGQAGKAGKAQAATKSGGKGPGLAQQVSSLQKTVNNLKIEYAKDRKIAARRQSRRPAPAHTRRVSAPRTPAVPVHRTTQIARAAHKATTRKAAPATRPGGPDRKSIL